MKSDKNGESVFRRFPDWKKQGSQIELLDSHWVKDSKPEMIDGVLVVKLRKSRFDQRKHIVGSVKSTDGNLAGFLVDIQSFAGEEKNHSDMFFAFTDEHGRFEADYLPGASYCLHVNDAQLVSNIIDLTPYEPSSEKVCNPVLEISKGQAVEIVATMGPDRKPIAYQYINLSTPHEYNFREDGEIQLGMGGRQWGVTTDVHGRATTVALPGKLEGSIHSSEWSTQQSVKVKTEGVTRLEFHRQVAGKRKLAGRLISEGGVRDFKDTVIEIGSIDGESHERLTLKADQEGKFEFESAATRIGFYARTKDEKAAAVAILDRFEGHIELRLQSTGEYCGQLLGKEYRPLKDHTVRVSLSVSGKEDYSKPQMTSFHAATFETKTDEEGKYTLRGLPREVKLNLSCASLDDSAQNKYLDEFYLVPQDKRPLAVSRLWRPEKKISFTERYEMNLRDCRLAHFHAMIILYRPSKDADRFVHENFIEYQKNKDVSRYMQLLGPIDEEPANAEVAEFARAKGLPTPEKGKVFACALDPSGKELGRIEFDWKLPDAAESAARFIREHAPPTEDAIKKWDEAFATAKQTHRKVWVRISQRYCGPCFRLTRWLDDHKEILEQDYMFLKIDNCRDLHGVEVADRLTGGEHFGVPFSVIFDSDEKKLIDGDSAVGNIGFPSGYEGKKHLRKMLTETRQKMTDKQIDELVESLED
jgi:hypothetical protein